MSQPFDRSLGRRPPASVDPKSLGEFWVNNPWDIVSRRATTSAPMSGSDRSSIKEGRNFLDISYLTGADNDGDGRSVVAGDFRNNGQLDLVVRQVGGGPLLLYENQFPKAHYLTVSLRGHTSNRLGIGARLKAMSATADHPRALPA